MNIRRLCNLALLIGLASAAIPAQASITFVAASAPTQSSSSVSSITVTAPTGITTNDILMVELVTNSGTQPDVKTAPSGWSANPTSSGNLGATLYWRAATSSDVAGTTTYTWVFTTAAPAAAAIIAFRGVLTSAPIVTGSLGTDSGITHTAPSITPGVANTMLVVGFAINNGNTDTLSVPTGMTQAYYGATGNGSGGLEIAMFYQLLSASTATGSRSTTSGSSLTTQGIDGSFALQPDTALDPLAQWHLDQSSWSGTSGEVVDSSGHAYNGVAVHGATTNGAAPALSGTPGTCYYGTFNGSTQYVQLPTSLPHLGSNSTITAWIQPTAAGTSGYGGRIFWDDYNLNGFLLSFGDPGNNELSIVTRSPNNHVNSSISLTVNSWYFVVAQFSTSGGTSYIYLKVYDSSGTLLDSQSASVSGTWSPGTGTYATIGADADSSAEGAHAHFQGNIDEVTLYDATLTNSQLSGLVLATHPCVSYAPNHYAISAASTAVNCQATPVTIAAHTSTHAAFATTDTIAITTTTGNGDWTLTTGSGTFMAGGSDTGMASYTYAAADDGVVVLALRDTHAETLTIGVTDGTVTATSGSAMPSEDSAITFVASGFRITNGSNVAATIATQVSGVTSTQSLALQAVRTDTNTGACTSVFASGASVSISLAYQCNNPSTCVAGQTLKITNNGTTTAAASNPNSALTSYTPVSLKFTTANAEAPFNLVYSDAGQITLAAKYVIPLGSGAGSGTSMIGAGQFVVQPLGLVLSNIKRTSSGLLNPAASTAAGTVFLPAGQPFSATVAAYGYPGTSSTYASYPTPNFGQETSPAAVALTTALVLPTSGDNAAVSGSFGTYSAGVATGTTFNWPEVGIITLTPSVAAYLATGNTVTGTTTGNVGRFIPNGFATSLNTPVFGAACSAVIASNSFTYVGQPFTYTLAPVITATAQALGGTTTLNYTGALMRLSNTSLTGRTYTPTPASPALTLTGLPATTADPVIAEVAPNTGRVTLTFGAGSGLSFARGTAIAPFSANIDLSENVIDADGVTATNPVTFSGVASAGIAFVPSSALQWYGRLAIRNSVGSELLDLPMSLTTQYYSSATQGFVTNTADSCSAAPTLAFSNYQQNLNSNALGSGGTCVRDSGSPGLSGIGCTAAATTNRYDYSISPLAGDFGLWLAAPAAGNNGAVTVTATAPTWLQYIWTGSTNSNPSGMATFGLFPGSTYRIYQREVY